MLCFKPGRALYASQPMSEDSGVQVHVNGQVSPLVTQGAVAMQRIVPAVQPAAKDFTVILLRLVIYLHPCCCDGEHVLCGLGLPPRVSEAAGCVQTVRMMFVCVSHQLGLLLDPMETIAVAAHFASVVLVVVEKGLSGVVSGLRQDSDFPHANSKFVVQAGGGHLAEPEELHGYLVVLALVSPASGPDKALLQHVKSMWGKVSIAHCKKRSKQSWAC